MTDVEIRQPVPLRTVPNIELAAIGTWKAVTGTTTFTAQDFQDAVAALDCPGVRNPVVKLGHTEADSGSGVRWDGEPALGWISGMRYDSDGKLRGDLTGLPAWLADPQGDGLSVLAAAYPDRSIEIYRPFTCQIGHSHPAVITALALVGVSPPGVGVLKSMQDVYAAWTVGADDGKATLTSTVAARLTAADDPRDRTDIERQATTDFGKLDADWTASLDALLEQWPDVAAAQRDELAAQIEQAVDEQPGGLGALVVTTTAAALLLAAALPALADSALTGQIAEARRQGVTIDPAAIDLGTTLDDIAAAVAAGMSASTASAAGRVAAQHLGEGDGKSVAATTLAKLENFTDRFLRDQIGGALSAAQGAARLAALREAPPGRYFASEINDTHACAPCRSVDGAEFESLDEAAAAYGSGKYTGCLGGARCRGLLVTVWPSTASAMSTTVRTSIGDTMGHLGAVKASVSVEDISRKYYESAGYSMWITAMHVDPLELIASDDSNGKFFRIPVELNGDQFTFGEPQEVAVVYEDVKAAATALPYRWQNKAAAMAVIGQTTTATNGGGPGGNLTVTYAPPIAPDVTPAGAAIRKMAAVQTPDAAPAAAGSTTEDKEASVDAAKLREALGLAADASDEDVRTALASAIPATPPPADTPDPQATLTAIPPSAGGAMLIDPENYKTLVSMAAKGEAAFAEMQKNKRDHVLDQAMKDGRFPVSRLSAYQGMWDKNPEATEQYIAMMPKNTVPTMSVGLLAAEVSQNETDLVYEAMYGRGN